MTKQNKALSRRAALKRTSVLLGGMMSVPLLRSIETGAKPFAESAAIDAQIEPFKQLLSIVAELIIPETDTAGAINAGVPDYINLMLAEWYTDEERSHFLDSLAIFDALASERGTPSFTGAPKDVQQNVLRYLDNQNEIRIFAELKELTVFGYYTSEAAVEELNYNPVPGSYRGCVSLDEIGRTWLVRGI